jgi:hypothetical protein
MPANYDVNEVIRQYVHNAIGERPALIKEITAGLRDSRAAMHLLSEIGEACLKNNMGPLEGLSFSLMQGIVIGILLEKERLRTLRQFVS